MKYAIDYVLSYAGARTLIIHADDPDDAYTAARDWIVQNKLYAASLQGACRPASQKDIDCAFSTINEPDEQEATTVLEIGSFGYVADPGDRTRCSERCGHYHKRVNAFHEEWCDISSMLGPVSRSAFCLDAEKHEAERHIGLLEFIADSEDPRQCSEDCPELHRACSHRKSYWRSELCFSIEKYGQERPARWVSLKQSPGFVACTACGENGVFDELPDRCPGCGKRMMQDGET